MPSVCIDIDFFAILINGLISRFYIVSPRHIDIKSRSAAFYIKANANGGRCLKSIGRNRLVVVLFARCVIIVSFKRGIAIDFLLI